MALTVLTGIAAGLITTVAGMGGGLLLLLVLAVISGDPVQALVVTSPALLLGNGHRLWRYRHDVDRATALPLARGAVPTALGVGMLTAQAPVARPSGGAVVSSPHPANGITARATARVAARAVLTAWPLPSHEPEP